MDLKGRSDRSTQQGFRIGDGAADLIGDIHRQQRRKILRRAAQFTALLITLFLLGFAFKYVADGRARAQSLDSAREHFARGTVVELREAIASLEASLAEQPGHDETLAALALARAQLWVEFGEAEAEARAAVAEGGELTDAVFARALLGLADGDATEALAAAAAVGDTTNSLAPNHHAWMVAVSSLTGDAQAMGTALAALEQARAGTWITAYDRVQAALLLASGDGARALEALERAREQNRTHMGLAADEALYNAYLRQELSGVADVADQLLLSEPHVLSLRDRAHARLARGVVHVQTGEPKVGLERIEESWSQLPHWDRIARDLALRTTLEAGDPSRVSDWLETAGLPEDERDAYLAWAQLAQGNVMASLAGLAKLPQEHPRVAYLQALALVEQGRFTEATAWLDRTETMLPGRIEIEVARARVELRSGDKAAALTKLQALAEQEPFAPRAWTGLGEAYMQQEEPDLRNAQQALKRATEREVVPAEAYLLLARVWNLKRETDADDKALEYLEKAAKVNPHLPRYRQELALYLGGFGERDRAIDLLEALADEDGTDPEALVRLVEMHIERAGSIDDELGKKIDGWLTKAESGGADPAELIRARATVVLATRDASLDGVRDELFAHLESKPDDVLARVLYSRIVLKLGERETAETTLRRGLQMSEPSDHGPLYLEWARLEARTGQAKKAAARSRVAWSRLLDEDRPAIMLLDAAELAAGLWLKQAKPKTALAIARKLTDRLPNRTDAWTIRASTELAANRAIEARASAERALDLDDENARAHELHGHTLLRFGYKDRAREAYERAVKLATGTPEEKQYRENLRRL